MLPIDEHREEIVQAVRENQVVIVVGETGSGKTTRIPVFLYEAGLAESGTIGVTEPRRIAATSVAGFVADQLGTKLGQTVGYRIRFDGWHQSNAVKFMTDGILLREFQEDRDLSNYSAIMVDEAHERSQNIDFVLGLLKDLLSRRPDFRVVVASATIDAGKFSRYFDGAPVILVSGRTFPVREVHTDRDIPLSGMWGQGRMDEMVQAVVEKVVEIHRTENSGDILVFLPGKDDISQVIDKLESATLPGLLVIPAHAGLTLEDQQNVFVPAPAGYRKVVVATNIAETSITIDGVVYVVDSGAVKQNNFHSNTGIQSLDLVLHSQAGCEQRKGRAGRTQPGVCYRMYTEDSFLERPKFTEPEIRRVSIAGVVLAMEDIGLDVESFEFLDPPDPEAFEEAYKTLITLGAIAPDKKGITDLGRQMAKLPLEPRIARMVLEAEKYGCVKQIATIGSFLSVQNVFVRPKGKEYEADRAHQQFKSSESDLLSFLEIWRQYEASGFRDSWCYQNFLNSRSLVEASKVMQQLFTILVNCGIALSSTDDTDVVMRSATAGLIYNLLKQASFHSFAGVLRQAANNVFIHPGSALFSGFGVTWLVPTEIVRTSKLFARNCTRVQPEWLPSLLPNLFWEETVLAEEVEVGRTYRASKRIMSVHYGEVGSESCNVDLEQAQRIQLDSVERAEAKGLRLLVFSREVGSFLQSDEGYRVLKFMDGIELHSRYYCDIREVAYAGSFARPVFRVFNLPLPRRVVTASPPADVPSEIVLTLGGNNVQVGTRK